MLTVGFIGFGNSVVRYNLPFIKDNPNVQVKWVYRRQEDRNLPGEEERELLYPDLRFTSDIADLLNDPDINLISINTHVDSHYDYAMQAIKARKNVLIEKPFTQTLEQASELFDYAKKMGCIVTCNNNRRFDADFRTLKRIIDDRLLGDLVEIQSHYHYFRPNPDKRMGLGFIAGLAIHPIDQMVYLFGTPDRVHFDVRSVLSEKGDDYVDIDFYYGKFKYTVKCSLCAKIDYPKFIAHGTRGSFIKKSQGHLSSQKKEEPVIIQFETETESNWGTLSYIDKDGTDVTKHVQTELTEYGKIYDNINNAIHDNEELLVKSDQIMEVLKIVKEAESQILCK